MRPDRPSEDDGEDGCANEAGAARRDDDDGHGALLFGLALLFAMQIRPREGGRGHQSPDDGHHMPSSESSMSDTTSSRL